MILLAAGLAGFAVLTLEILGVHWLAPWFGTSALVWTNQIGIVLLALAGGGWLGAARARSSRDPVRSAGALLLGAGALLGFALAVLPPFARWLLPEELRLEEAATVFLGGSFGTAALFFAPPVLLLGMVSPLLVESRSLQRGAGGAAGEIYAVGTLGSLLGVFGTTLVALPFLGLRVTLAVTAAALLLAGLLLLRVRRTAAPLALLAGLPLLMPDLAESANLPRDAQGNPAHLVAVRETPYQRLRVVEFDDGVRWLQMNEGLDSFQSIHRPGSAWPGGYYDLFSLAPVYALEGRAGTAPAGIWILGYGSGALLGPVAASLREREWRAVGVELDPAVVELGRAHLPLPAELEARTDVVAGADARSLLRAAPRDLDLVLLDAYARQFEIPLHLATEEFFREVHGHLRPGGVFALNVGTSENPGDPSGFADAITAGLSRVFDGHVRAHRVPRSRNIVLFARRGLPLLSLDELAAGLPENLPVEVGAACLRSHVQDGPPSSARAPLTDDRNPLALRQSLQWLGGRGNGGGS